jgi:hypothetical protein
LVITANLLYLEIQVSLQNGILYILDDSDNQFRIFGFLVSLLGFMVLFNPRSGESFTEYTKPSRIDHVGDPQLQGYPPELKWLITFYLIILALVLGGVNYLYEDSFFFRYIYILLMIYFLIKLGYSIYGIYHHHHQVHWLMGFTMIFSTLFGLAILLSNFLVYLSFPERIQRKLIWSTLLGLCLLSLSYISYKKIQKDDNAVYFYNSLLSSERLDA